MAPLNWTILVRRAHTNSVSWVILTSIYAFLAGVGFTVLLGPFPVPRDLAIYAPACFGPLHAAVWLRATREILRPSLPPTDRTPRRVHRRRGSS
jgi:hypothetical protein